MAYYNQFQPRRQPEDSGSNFFGWFCFFVLAIFLCSKFTFTTVETSAAHPVVNSPSPSSSSSSSSLSSVASVAPVVSVSSPSLPQAKEGQNLVSAETTSLSALVDEQKDQIVSSGLADEERIKQVGILGVLADAAKKERLADEKVSQQSSSSLPASATQYASTIYYYPDGKTTKSVEEYDQKNGKKIKITNYESDGKTIQYVEEYNANGNKIKRIKYDRSNNIDYIDEYNDDGDKIKYSEYIYSTGSSVVQKIIVKQYDPSNSRLISHKVFDKQGKLLQTIC
ncbi:DUF2963 domain-containing protein [Candidatus Phytoplasma pini]|uniref:DUF2963 domain-containing protein n=1 Tax=Candidatus Phytoplasma pini TaxID=267362 RepID=A0A559KIY0_9MOLU|nr:DUF2963 domain-containing protein [Candidatus Phytoplasma pini]TVY12094.1 hypothetical protein MDPP_00359 [Candidatus Phytoplasma pini]